MNMCSRQPTKGGPPAWGLDKGLITHLIMKMKEGEMVRHAACMGEIRNTDITLVRKSEGKTPLRRLRCRWEEWIFWK
jgi:hypothetical protein